MKFFTMTSCYSEAGLLNKSSHLAAALGVTKFIKVMAIFGHNLVTICWLLKSDLDVQQTHLNFVKMLMKGPVGKMSDWQNGELRKCQCGRQLSKCQFDEMASWKNGKLENSPSTLLIIDANA